MLEVGSGQSTLWLAARVGSVLAVEHDERWARVLASRLPANAEVRYAPCDGDLLTAEPDDAYVREATAFGDAPLDLYVVDGRARLRCLETVAERSARPGIVLLDNADWPAMAPGIDAMARHGFVRVDFVGPAPGGTNFSCTSAFLYEGRLPAPRTSPRSWGTQIADFGVV